MRSLRLSVKGHRQRLQNAHFQGPGHTCPRFLVVLRGKPGEALQRSKEAPPPIEGPDWTLLLATQPVPFFQRGAPALISGGCSHVFSFGADMCGVGPCKGEGLIYWPASQLRTIGATWHLHIWYPHSSQAAHVSFHPPTLRPSSCPRCLAPLGVRHPTCSTPTGTGDGTPPPMTPPELSGWLVR